MLDALRDLFLIITGVFLALGADSWRDARQDRKAERALLRAMRHALSADLNKLEGTIGDCERLEATNRFLYQHLSECKPYSEDLDAHFGLAHSGVGRPPNVAPYEALKARGLHLVSDEELRLGIVGFYEHTYWALDQVRQLDISITTNVMRPYYLRHFSSYKWGESAKPINYIALCNDQQYRNVLAYRAEFLRCVVIASHREAMQAVRDLANLLDGRGREQTHFT
jgi:hypothetical protein